MFHFDVTLKQWQYQPNWQKCVNIKNPNETDYYNSQT